MFINELIETPWIRLPKIVPPRPAPVVSRCPELWSWTPPKSPWVTWYAEKPNWWVWGSCFPVSVGWTAFWAHIFWPFLGPQKRLSWHWSLLTFEASKKLDATGCWHCCPTCHMHSGCQMSSRAAVEVVFGGAVQRSAASLPTGLIIT